MKIKGTKWEMKPSNAIAAALIYLILAWGFSYLIDVHNFLGYRALLFSEDMEVQLLWYYLFHDGFITEWFQWLFLGATVFSASYLGGRLVSYGYKAAASFWLIMGIAAVFMFIEDAFNTRHYIATIVRHIAGTEDLASPIVTVTHLIYFSILGAVPLYALVRYWRHIWCEMTTRLYLVFGFAAYGVAVIASGTRDILSWYSVVGEFINQQIADGVMSNYFTQTEPSRPLGFYLMDSLVEESIELIAASALFASTIAYLKALNQSSETGGRVFIGHPLTALKQIFKM